MSNTIPWLAAIPSSWPAPNYTNPETHGKAILIVSCTLGPLTLALVGARLWARVGIQRNAGLDDLLILIGMLPIIGIVIAVNIASEVYGFNLHTWDGKIANAVPQRKLTFALNYLTLYAATLIRVSILLFYRRLADNSVSRPFHIATWATLVFVVAYAVIISILGLVSCRPLSAFWDQYNIAKLLSGYSYKCGNEATGVMTSAVVNAVQDFLTTTLPAILCWRLRVSVREKVALIAIFACGYIVCIIAILRIRLIHRIFWVSRDVTWDAWTVYLLTVIELLVATICASVPALKVFFRHYFTDHSSTFGSSGPRGGSRNAAGANPTIGSYTHHSRRSRENNHSNSRPSRSPSGSQKSWIPFTSASPPNDTDDKLSSKGDLRDLDDREIALRHANSRGTIRVQTDIHLYHMPRSDNPPQEPAQESLDTLNGSSKARVTVKGSDNIV